MRFTVSESARKDIRKLPPVTRRALDKKLRYWEGARQPLRSAVPLLQHREATHRFRLGAYRIIVKRVGGRELRVLRVRHRKDVYR